MTNSYARIANLDDLVVIGTTQYRVTEVTENGLWLETLCALRLRKFLDFAALEKLRKSPDYRVIKGYFGRPHGEPQPINSSILARLTQNEIEKLNDSVAMTEWLLEKERAGEMTRSDNSMKAQLPALNAHMAAFYKAGRATNHRTKRTVYDLPSLKTLRKMMIAYSEAGHDLLALIPKKVTRPSARRLDLKAAEILRRTVKTQYYNSQRVSAGDVLLAVEDAIDAENARRMQCGEEALAYPCLRTVYREIDKLDPLDTHAARHGKKSAKDKFALTHTGVKVTRPLERIEIDEVRLDVLSIAIDSGRAAKMTPKQLRALERTRRWAVVAIDVATRCILGLVVTSAPCREATLKVMEQTTRDKSDIAAAYGCESDWRQSGRGELFVMDNGTGFVPIGIRMAAAAMQATAKYTQAGEPSQRATIERFFGTLGSRLMPHLPGRTFSNPQERGDYPSEETACLTDDEVTLLVTQCIVDCYHQTPHAGLAGETPARAWERLTTKYPLVDDLSGYERREAFGRRYIRKVTGNGITLFGIQYSGDLTAHIHLHEKNDLLECRLDERDLGWISVRWNDEWVPLKAKWDFFDGVHLADWLETLRVMHEQNKPIAQEGRRKIRDFLDRTRTIVDAARTRCNIGPDSWNSAKLSRLEKELTRSMRSVDQGADTTAEVTLGTLFDDDFDQVVRFAQGEISSAEPPRPDRAAQNDDDDYVEISK